MIHCSMDGWNPLSQHFTGQLLKWKKHGSLRHLQQWRWRNRRPNRKFRYWLTTPPSGSTAVESRRPLPGYNQSVCPRSSRTRKHQRSSHLNARKPQHDCEAKRKPLPWGPLNPWTSTPSQYRNFRFGRRLQTKSERLESCSAEWLGHVADIAGVTDAEDSAPAIGSPIWRLRIAEGLGMSGADADQPADLAGWCQWLDSALQQR